MTLFLILGLDVRTPKTAKPRSFIVRRDPRDISVIWFLDPNTDQYYPVPYRNLSHPHMTLWELRARRAQLKREGQAEVDEEMIFATYERLNRKKQDAQASTVSARMAMQKRRERGVAARCLRTHRTGQLPYERAGRLADDEWEDGELSPYEIKLAP